MSAEPRTQPGQRALRLVPPATTGPAGSPAANAAAIPAPEAAPTPTPATPSPALRRLQRDLEAARAEARCLQELLEELPAILERKFHLRLQAILSEQRQLEADNALLQHRLFALGSSADLMPLLPSPQLALPPAAPAVQFSEEPLDDREDSAITQGLGLRRALRLRHL